MREAQYWDRVYREKEPDRVSWYQQVPAVSLALIEAAGLPRAAAILDVGGGASSLALHLLEAGYSDVTVADISEQALVRARRALAGAARQVSWVRADVRSHEFDRPVALWHDRAVFHFMTAPEDRAGYLDVLTRTLTPGGHLVLSTFGPGGPEQCSGLPVVRYGAEDLLAVLGPGFSLVSAQVEQHRTPSGNVQEFTCAHFRHAPPSGAADHEIRAGSDPDRA